MRGPVPLHQIQLFTGSGLANSAYVVAASWTSSPIQQGLRHVYLSSEAHISSIAEPCDSAGPVFKTLAAG